MAMKHRKLFPALTATNQTIDCSDFCDPACPYNCYTYSDYYFLPPPPPPPTSASLLSQEHHLSPFVIVIVILLASAFLLVSYFVIIGKSCSGWCGSRNSSQAQGQGDNTDEEFLDENRVDHPIWYITTIGLQQSIINSITVLRYKKGEGLIEGIECSVCLNEFQQDETLRLLPKCNHAFHISCIDTWLRSHTNCPLCRAHIVNDAVITPLVSVNQNPHNLNTIVSTQMENPETGGELVDLQETNGLSENRTGAQGGSEILVVGDERILKEDVNSNDNSVFQVLHDSGDNNQGLKKDIRPVRRSFSVDSSTAATICLGLDNYSPVESEGSSVNQIENTDKTNSAIVLKQDDRYSSSFRLMGSSLITQCLHKSPISMKRSFSCGGRFFSSRQNRSLNSILPL